MKEKLLQSIDAPVRLPVLRSMVLMDCAGCGYVVLSGDTVCAGCWERRTERVKPRRTIVLDTPL